MRLTNLAVSVVLIAILKSANAAPILTATFDMTFQGYAFVNQPYEGPISDPIHDMVTVEIPLITNYSGGYSGSSQSYYQIGFGDFTQYMSGINFISGVIDNTFNQELILRLNAIGATGLTAANYSANAWASKQEYYGQLTQYYSNFAASNSQWYEVQGWPYSTVLNVYKDVSGSTWGDTGDVLPFTVDNVPELLNGINNFSPSPFFEYEPFTLRYSARVDHWENGIWSDSPFMFEFSGRGSLVSLKLDGVETLSPTQVPLPPTALLMATALGLLGFTRSRQQPQA